MLKINICPPACIKMLVDSDSAQTDTVSIVTPFRKTILSKPKQ